MPFTKESYAQKLSNFDRSTKIHFYEVFVHNPTVSIRAIWSDPETSDAEKVAGVKEINEILHRIIMKISTERRKTHEWKDEDIFSILCSVNDMRADPKGHIGAALKSTCNAFGIEIPNQ